MECLRVAACYLFAVCVLEVDAIPQIQQCQRQEFFEFRNAAYNGKLILRDGPWPVKSCQRLCRQYSECYTCTVEWSGSQVGICSIFNGLVKKKDLVEKSGTSTYLSCPAKLLYYPTVDRCFSRHLHTPPKPWDEAFLTCQRMHPGTKLPQACYVGEDDIKVLMSISGGIEIWLDKSFYTPNTCRFLKTTRYSPYGSQNCSFVLPFVCEF